MKEWSPITPPPHLKSSFINDSSPSPFLYHKWDSWLNGQSWPSPHLKIKVCNNETNEKPNSKNTGTRQNLKLGTPGRKVNTTHAELTRILPDAVVRYCIQIGMKLRMKGW